MGDLQLSIQPQRGVPRSFRSIVRSGDGQAILEFKGWYGSTPNSQSLDNGVIFFVPHHFPTLGGSKNETQEFRTM